MPQRTQPDRVIGGRYRLITEIGSGGFGRVWKAHDEVLHADVAVKEVWLPPTMSEAERRERLIRAKREASNAAKLRDHPHVVTVYDTVIEDDTPWIVMRLVVGRSLQNRVDADGPVSVEEAARIADGLLSALGAAHAADIVHRDVKPANVLLADGTSSGAADVLLTDFGIAVHKADTALTASSVIVGSAEYAAPERLRDNEGQPTSDLFSLGATLYFAVEGVSPFRRATSAATTIAILTEDPRPPRRADRLAPLIIGLLNKDPAKRPTIAQAQALLNPAPAPTTPSAPKPGTPPPSTPPPSTPPSRTPPSAVPQGPFLRPRPPAKTKKHTAAAVILVLVTVGAIIAAAGLLGSQVFSSFINSSLDRESTDTTPQTVDALLPRSFTDSKNISYTLRSSGVQNCVSNLEGQNVQRILENAQCGNAIVGAYVDYSNQILVSVWVVPLSDAATAATAQGQLQSLFTNAWGFLYPQQGAGAQLATASLQEFDAATQSGYTTASHRYLIHTVAVYISLPRAPSLMPWVTAAAWQADRAVGPVNYRNNH